MTSSNRRGQTILDMLLVIVFLFIIGIGMIFGAKVFTDVNTDIQADPDISDYAKNDLNTSATNYPTIMDNAFILLMSLLWVALIVTSFLIDSHPVFFVITVILLVFVFIVGMILANAFQDVVAEDDLAESAALFPMTNWVFENFLLLLIAMGFSTALALYAKARI